MKALVVWNTPVKSNRALEWLKVLLVPGPRGEVESPVGLSCRGLWIKRQNFLSREDTGSGEEWKRADIRGPRNFKNISVWG